MLNMLRMRDVGPAPNFEIRLADRLNIFTGDNGLGKTFILDVAWWSLTGTWANHPASPRKGSDSHPLIAVEFKGRTRAKRLQMVSEFDYPRQVWPRKDRGFDLPSLVVYARIDGSFSVWDPARLGGEGNDAASDRQSRAFHFTPKEIWDGLPPRGDQTVCNGLIRDWVYWQLQHKVERIRGDVRSAGGDKPSRSSQFEILERIIKELVTTPGEPVRIGEPVRLSALDVRDYPTLAMPYGEVPLVLASAGQKRIAAFAYLLAWAWDEHKKASRLRKQEPAKQFVLLVDEVESHLHPQWQRTIVPSLLELGKALGAQVEFQILATTHAPLVLASIEPHFDQDRDALFLLELERGAGRVSLQKIPWAKQGDAVAWLTSPLFGLGQGRSREAETAIEAAEAFMRGDRQGLPPGLRTKAAIQKALEKTLPGMDPFWPRWIVEARP